jgi:hypothetical protein
MNDQHAPDGEQDRFEIVFEVPPSPQGAYQYERDDGTNVHGDAGGEWTLDEDGEIDDMRRLLVEPLSEHEHGFWKPDHPLDPCVHAVARQLCATRPAIFGADEKRA